MVKSLLIPMLAASAWAWQGTPSADTVAALRARVQQFYQLEVDKKYRQAESMIADDTKDDYYNSRKPDLKGFSVESVELMKDNTQAKVLIKAKVLILMPGAGAQIFDMPTPTYWKLENNEWRWFVPEELKTGTPFGKMKTGDSGTDSLSMKGAAPGGIANPNLGALLGQITIDKTAIELSEAAPDAVATITNQLPGGVDLRVDPHVEVIKGLTVKVDKIHLEHGEKTDVHFHLAGKEKIADVIEIAALPLNRVLDITVRTK